ncbi:hypothetical protein ARMSODRAFT_606379 [Armillaria solidipes]|uniref:Uncharacterized protein n=1 Tax=Armillaria solidipes TaxID=1076256 RepID=A0A2H3B8X5_9AGAR|nr:hypothetical protein ARMSODRAFT_606379 [Armillaria solidipes]
MRMGHEHNGWLAIAEPSGDCSGDDGTRDAEKQRDSRRNDPPWKPVLGVRRACHHCRQPRWAARQCIYECTVVWFIANGVVMAGPVGLAAGKEGDDPGVEGGGISGRNVARSSFARI